MNADETRDDRFTVPSLGLRLFAGTLDFVVVLVAAWSLRLDGTIYVPALLCIYHTFFVWLVGKTLGKALLGLEVRRSGRPRSLLWAFGRSSLGFSLVNGFGVGFLAALADPARRALHDRAFGSLVMLDEAELGVKWSNRLKTWADNRQEVFKKKTEKAETFAVLAGIWGFLKSAAGYLKKVAEWLEHALAAVRPAAQAAVTQALPAAPAATQAMVLVVGCSAFTAAVLATVPGAGMVRAVRGPNGSATRFAVDGQPVQIRVGLEPLGYTVDFGDGTAPESGIVTGGPFLELNHTYQDSTPGSSYKVRFTVTDDDGLTVGSAEYDVEFVGGADDARVVKALDDAFWQMHTSQVQTDDPATTVVGNWTYSNYPVGATALATLAYEVNGFEGRAADEGTYRDTVNRALAYLLSRCVTTDISMQTAGDPDSNGNGFGITIEGSGQALYELPLVAMALVGSRNPDAVARTGPAGVRGERRQPQYRDIVTDMLDFIAFAQADGEGDDRGGWRYAANNGADMSVTQWPVLAMMSAEEVWGLEVPPWVATELRDGFLAASQDDSGGFGYSVGAGPDIAMTAAGLIGLSFAGVAEDDERVTTAIDWIGQNWGSADNHTYYAMYAVKKAAELRRREIEFFDEHDWKAEYRTRLLESQQPNGTWPNSGRGSGILATAWPALILSEEVFATNRLTALIRWFRNLL